MFDPTSIAIDAFLDLLKAEYVATYGQLEPDYPGMIAFGGRIALENIANSDAPYHDVRHTMMVTLAGQAILKGKHICEGGVSPHDWLHTVLSMLFHVSVYNRKRGENRRSKALQCLSVRSSIGATEKDFFNIPGLDFGGRILSLSIQAK